MDILDLVALMQKYAEENPEILEFEHLETTDKNAKNILIYNLKVLKPIANKYYFQLINHYPNQQSGSFYTNYISLKNLHLTRTETSPEKILEYLKDWVNNISSIQTTYLANIKVKSFFCIKEEINLNNLQDKKEIYLLGENGDGKTLILQAILIGLKYYFIQNQAEKKQTYVGVILDLINQSNLLITIIDSLSNPYKIEKSDTFLRKKIVESKFVSNIFAYGVHRSRNNNLNPELYGFGTLFSDDVYLRSPIEWLKDIERLELKQLNKSITLQNVINILEDLLGKNVKIRIEKDVIFEERGFPVQFDALSEGYKSVMTWVADLVSRLAENQPNVKPIEVDGKINFPYQGIVLVDEISLHLHPKWEYQIVRKLRDWFPNIQFIMTTHSPVTVLGASEDALFYKVYKEKGITHVSEPYTSESIKNLMANGVLTSPLFDLESAAMSIAKDDSIDTSDDYTYTLIHKQIAEQVKKLKSEGKVYISSEMLNEMVAKAIEKHKKAS